MFAARTTPLEVGWGYIEREPDESLLTMARAASAMTVAAGTDSVHSGYRESWSMGECPARGGFVGCRVADEQV